MERGLLLHQLACPGREGVILPGAEKPRDALRHEEKCSPSPFSRGARRPGPCNLKSCGRQAAGGRSEIGRRSEDKREEGECTGVSKARKKLDTAREGVLKFCLSICRGSLIGNRNFTIEEG